MDVLQSIETHSDKNILQLIPRVWKTLFVEKPSEVSSTSDRQTYLIASSDSIVIMPSDCVHESEHIISGPFDKIGGKNPPILTGYGWL